MFLSQKFQLNKGKNVYIFTKFTNLLKEKTTFTHAEFSYFSDPTTPSIPQ